MLPSNQATEQRSNPKLEVLYEDEALLFINKPANIVVQRGYDPNEPNWLKLVLANQHGLFHPRVRLPAEGELVLY